ncbi:MAG: C39 family peptidase [Lachnospiraceae bacterium]|nr:C39 family peptidase [Lachnospiraceae bacterium]
MGELRTISMEKSKLREEQLRKEQAMEERRKRELREKRRKQQKIRFFAVWSFIILTGLLIVLLLVSAISNVFSGEEETTTAKKQNTNIVEISFDPSSYIFTEDMYRYENSAEMLNKLSALKDDVNGYDKIIDFMLSNEAAYPESLIKLVTKSPEALEFAVVYPFMQGESDSRTVDLTNDYKEGQIPYLMQWDSRWGYVVYGDDTIALDGCGPTCLSMVTVGLTGNVMWSPIRVARISMEQGYYVKGTGTAWALMSEGCEKMGLKAKEIGLAKDEMINEITSGRPIIASMAPGDFTDAGHFIVIDEYKDGMFYVKDPNNKENSQKGWTYDQLNGQIKNMWSYRVID